MPDKAKANFDVSVLARLQRIELFLFAKYPQDWIQYCTTTTNVTDQTPNEEADEEWQ